MANLHKIKDLAKQKNLTLKALADLSGISEQGLHKILRLNSTSIETLESIANALNVPVSIFFEENKSVSISATAEKGSAASVTGDAFVAPRNCDSEVLRKEIVHLNREIEHYKARLEEKERLIKVLMEKI